MRHRVEGFIAGVVVTAAAILVGGVVFTQPAETPDTPLGACSESVAFYPRDSVVYAYMTTQCDPSLTVSTCEQPDAPLVCVER